MKKLVTLIFLLISKFSVAEVLPTSQPPFNIPDGYRTESVQKQVEFDELKNFRLCFRGLFLL